MELKRYEALSFDWFAIYQCGLVAPLAKSLSDGHGEVRWTEDQPYIFDATVFGDGGFDAD